MASSGRLAHSVPVPLPRPALSGNYPYITTRSYVGPPDAAYAYWNEKTGRGLRIGSRQTFRVVDGRIRQEGYLTGKLVALRVDSN
jgi:hypothetical protein